MQYIVIVGARETGEEEYDYRDCGGANAFGPFTRDEAYAFAADAEKYITDCGPKEFVYGEPFVILAPFLQPTEHRDSRWGVDYFRLQPESV